jgi:6-phosphogluconolactonase
MAYHVYISNASSEFLSHFIMDEDTGALDPQSNIDLVGAPGAVATNADGSLMWVALRSAKALASYTVDKSSGQLSQIGTSAQDEGPPYLATDNTASYLLSSYYGSGQVAVHRINADGTLSDGPIQTLETDGHAHSIQTDRSNRFAFVPHTNPANAIFQFRFDAATGALSPNDPPKIQPETEEGPRHFAFHPAKDLLYSINENGSTISAHHFDPNAGTLSSFQVISTVPEGTDLEGKSTAEIKITPDGKHLYGSNRGHDTLAHFAIAADGTLSAIGHYPTEATPRFFELDPSGRFVYAVGQGSGGLTAYRIDATTGALDPFEQHKVGESPLWITFIKQA